MATIKRINGEEIGSGDMLVSAVQDNKRNLFGANLCDADLRRANLTGANLRGAGLSDANLRDANLTGANLTGANPRDADLCGADLTGANLCGAGLSDADLSGAGLSDADLSGADLDGAIGNSIEVMTIQSDQWTVTRTADVIQIGCKQYPIKKWLEFTDRQIAAMDKNALEWWRLWKPLLRQIIEIAPARPTGHEGDAR